MFPAQTSLIPVTVAITKYVAAHGFGGNYPYWYLGTTPVKYLTGPVVPAVLIGLQSLFGTTNYFTWAILLVLVSQFIWAAGWFVFVKFLSGSLRLGILVAGLVLLSPLDLVLSLGLGETSAILAVSFTPWVLFLFAKYKSFIPASLSFAFLLLTNTVSAIPAILGLIILVFVTEKKWEAGLKRLFLVFAIGWLLTLWWYSPGYWFTLLGAPSIGGRSVIGSLNAIFGFIKGLAPVFLAVAVVSFGFAKRTKLEKFAAIWLFTFGIFTLFRMFSDIDFWMDWTAWMGEAEVGLVLLISGVLSQFLVSKKRSTNLNSGFELQNPSRSSLRQQPILSENSKVTRGWLRHVFGYFKTAPQVKVLILIFIVYFVAGWGLAWQKRDFWLPRREIGQTVEFKIAKWLEKETVNCEPSTVNCQLIFLSGSTAFWLNSLVDVKQVRGGVDQASVDKIWREAAWEVREGGITEDTEKALKALNINYIVVHNDQSAEFYHDFKNVEKFENTTNLVKFFEELGDLIYKVQ